MVICIAKLYTSILYGVSFLRGGGKYKGSLNIKLKE